MGYFFTLLTVFTMASMSLQAQIIFPTSNSIAGDYISIGASGGSDGDVLILNNSGNLGINSVSPTATLDVGGDIKFGNSSATCDVTIEGSQHYNSVDKAMEYCNGTSWVQYSATVSSSGTPPVWPSGTGYFVLTNGTWNGNLGGIGGANDKCLSDLTANTWLNKASAILDSDHVKAFICNVNSCNNLTPTVTYTFAHSGSATDGGATFTTDASGKGPQNSQNWSAVNYFGGDFTYWSNRSADTSELWANSNEIGYTSASCHGYNSNNSSYYSLAGKANHTNAYRWSGTEATYCNTSHRLICFVNP